MGSELNSSVTESRGTTVCRLGLLRPQASLANTWKKNTKVYWGKYWCKKDTGLREKSRKILFKKKKKEEKKKEEKSQRIFSTNYFLRGKKKSDLKMVTLLLKLLARILLCVKKIKLLNYTQGGYVSEIGRGCTAVCMNADLDKILAQRHPK